MLKLHILYSVLQVHCVTFLRFNLLVVFEE